MKLLAEKLTTCRREIGAKLKGRTKRRRVDKTQGQGETIAGRRKVAVERASEIPDF
jgi:hypothetical protein